MEQVVLKEGECLEDLQLNSLRIIQKENGFRFGIDAVLLSDYVRIEKKARVIDLGTGSGIIPLLLSAKTHAAEVVGIEIQPEMAEMAKRSILLNRLENRICIDEGDLRTAVARYGSGNFDAVVTNPPYTKVGSGILNPQDAKAVSRHEIHCTLQDVISVSSRLLKQYGRLFMVHRPERLVDIFSCMRNYQIEPKTIRLVYPTQGKSANMVLVYGLKCGNPQVTVEPPYYMYSDA